MPIMNQRDWKFSCHKTCASYTVNECSDVHVAIRLSAVFWTAWGWNAVTVSEFHLVLDRPQIFWLHVGLQVGLEQFILTPKWSLKSQLTLGKDGFSGLLSHTSHSNSHTSTQAHKHQTSFSWTLCLRTKLSNAFCLVCFSYGLWTENDLIPSQALCLNIDRHCLDLFRSFIFEDS